MAPITEQLKTATDLEAAGLPQAAARVLAAKFEETAALARKSAEDGIAGRFDKLEAQMEARFAEMRAEIAQLRADMVAEFARVRVEMRAEIAELRAEMQQSFRSVQSTTLTAIGIATGFLAVFFAALTLVLHYAR